MSIASRHPERWSTIAGGLKQASRSISGLPLRWQIGGLVLVGLVVIFGLFGLLGSAIAQDGKQRTMSEWLSITRSTAGFLDAEIEEHFEQLERVAVLIGAQQSDPGRQEQVLSDALGQPESFVSEAFVLDNHGNVAWSRSVDRAALADYAQADARLIGLQTGGARYASGVQSLSNQPVTILAVPVLGDDRRPVGVVGEIMRPDQGLMNQMVASARGLAHSGHAELVDDGDRIIASSEDGRIFATGEHPDFYEPLLAQHKTAVGRTGPVTMTADRIDAGQRHVMAFVPLNSVSWGLALGGTETELDADASRWQRQIALFGGITLVLALGLVWLTTRGVARPIEALTSASRRIAGGDLTTPIPHEGEGEVRILAQAFDEMRNDLQTALSALALEKSRYEGIVGSMADAVITTDPHLRITAFNPAASALTGWHADEVLGQPCCDVLCGKETADADCLSSCSMRGDTPELGVNKETIQTRDGQQVHVAVTRSAIRDQDGHLAGVVQVLRDISAEEELSRLKDEFLSTVSHELRTPLGFIKGYATTLLLPDAPDDKATARHCVEVIVEASDELEELVDNLLDMTKIGAGSLSVSPAPARLRPLVHAAIERSRVRGQGYHLLMFVAASLPPVWADAHRIEQVLYNLLDNAIKYSPSGGHIAVQTELVGNEVVVSVLDEGMGIPADELLMLFERFYRGKAARARAIGGSGLGLAICKGIVQAHGGRIWAESPARASNSVTSPGTAIRFTLQVAPNVKRMAGGRSSVTRQHAVGGTA